MIKASHLSDRQCWWCDGLLSKTAQTIAHDHDGNPVRVHKTCAKAVERENKRVTAAESVRR